MEQERQIQVPVGDVAVIGDLTIPSKARSVVIFSHGSGSSRLSSRNRLVAERLQQNGFATLLFDLLTSQEDQDVRMRFDIPLLATRLVKVTEWLTSKHLTKDLVVGYFGASTGAAAALHASVHFDTRIKAIVSRGGRADLSIDILPLVKSPTLLIVGSLDYEVMTLNELAFNLLKVEKQISIVQDANHLFEEQGKLEEVSELALGWFRKYLQE